MMADAFALLTDPDWITHRLVAKAPVWEIIRAALGKFHEKPLPEVLVMAPPPSASEARADAAW
jgi:hypothetical protein